MFVDLSDSRQLYSVSMSKSESYKMSSECIRLFLQLDNKRDVVFLLWKEN